MNEAPSPSPTFWISQIRTMAPKSSHLPKPRSAPSKHCRNMANWERHELCFHKMNKSQRSSARPVANSSVLRALGFPGGASGKEPACQRKRCKRREFSPWVGKIPWRRAWRPTLVFSPGESHGQRSLAGYSPWGFRGSDTAEAPEHAV